MVKPWIVDSLPTVMWQPGALNILDTLDDEIVNHVLTKMKILEQVGIKKILNNQLLIKKLKSRKNFYILRVKNIRILFELKEGESLLVHDVIMKKTSKLPRRWDRG